MTACLWSRPPSTSCLALPRCVRSHQVSKQRAPYAQQAVTNRQGTAHLLS